MMALHLMVKLLVNKKSMALKKIAENSQHFKSSWPRNLSKLTVKLVEIILKLHPIKINLV